jgi:DNA end-binding protein Ku
MSPVNSVPAAVADTAHGNAGTPQPASSRASWSGLVQFSLVAFPVKAYPAVSSTEVSHFHQLHGECGQRIRYEKRCPVHGAVDAAAIVRGYPYAPDRYVILEATELDQLRPPQDRVLRLEKFLEPVQLDPALFAGRSLYLLPDGLGAQRPYRLLAEALAQRGRWALGRVVLSGHRQLVVLRPAGGRLTVDVLHFPEKVRQQPSWPGSMTAAPVATPEELQLAGQLIDTASTGIDWPQYRDESAAELAALVEAKVAGQQSVAPVAEPVAVIPLLEALKQSVAGLCRPARAQAGENKSRKAPRRRTA